MTAFAKPVARRLLPAAFVLALLGAPAPVVSAEAAAPATATMAQESKLVEYEVSEAIVERLMKWAGWFGFAVGIPVGVLALILTVLGVRSYADLQTRMNAARDEVDARLAQLAKLKTELGELDKSYAELARLEQKVRDISGRVNKLESVAFETTRELTPNLKKALEATLARYIPWLAERGAGDLEDVKVLVKRLDELNARYVGGRIEIDIRIAKDPDVILREYTHHMLEGLRPRDPQEWGAIHSGLADYLPCSFNETPKFAVKSAPVFRTQDRRVPVGYLRLLENDKRLDLDGELHDVGEAWGGAFWTLRAHIAPQTLDTLLLKAWASAPSVADGATGRVAFANRVIAVAAEHSKAAGAAAAAEFARRRIPTASKAPARRRKAAA